MLDDARVHLDARHGDLLAFWSGKDEGQASMAPVEAHCDMIYAMTLLGLADEISETALETFMTRVDSLDLPGFRVSNSQESVGVHNTAYLFGALNLCPFPSADLFSRLLEHRDVCLDEIREASSSLPIYPKRWAHHSWRVSHWLGGVPSLLLSLGRSGVLEADKYLYEAHLVRDAVERVIDEETGYLRPYRSRWMQSGFRLAYALRHDPKLGDLGGIAHVLWFDHSVGAPYSSSEALESDARIAFHQNAPFMETKPYCLDFDVVQILRTASHQSAGIHAADQARAQKLIEDLSAYFSQLGSVEVEDYTLHRFVGALATFHESALLAGVVEINGQPPIDIIESANWL